MTDITVITSWSEAGGRLYGGRWVEGIERHWCAHHDHISYRIVTDDDLAADPEFASFMARELGTDADNDNVHRGATKWAHKVFALTMAPIPTSGWMIWIDGDVEFIKTPSPEFFDAVCPDDADVSFLDRPWAYASETGFVAYRMESPAVQELLRLMRHTYISGEFRNLSARTGGTMPEWGDAAVFDYCRGVLLQEGAGLRENNLCPGNKPRDGLHVWPQTVLADYLRHHKGVNRKREAYGGAV